MYSLSSFLNSFRGLSRAQEEVAEAKQEASKPNTFLSAFDFRTRNHGGPGSNDKFGRYTREEQIDVITRKGTRTDTPDTFIKTVREPSPVSSYVSNLINRTNDYTQSRAYKIANNLIDRNGNPITPKTSIYSSGIDRLGAYYQGLYESMDNSINERYS